MAEMISHLNTLLRENERLRVALARLHDWALAQEGDCMFSGDHPIAQAAAVLAGTPGPAKRDHIAECSAASTRVYPATDHGCGLGRECWCEEGREIAACPRRKAAAGVNPSASDGASHE